MQKKVEVADGPNSTRYIDLTPEELLDVAQKRWARAADTYRGVERAIDQLEQNWTFRAYVQLQRFVDWQQSKIDAYFRRKLLKCG